MSYINRPIKEAGPDWAALYRCSQRNAAARGIRFDLTRRQFDELVRVADGRCMLSGILFSFRKGAKGERRPFAASIDRIESSKGYTARNCRLVCVAVNIALNTWGIEPLLRVAQNLIAQQDQLKQNGPAGFVIPSEYLTEIGSTLPPKERARIAQLAARLCREQGIERAIIERPHSPIKKAYPRAIVIEAAARLTTAP